MKNRVLMLRRMRGWTQGQLSQRTGIHRGTISRIERGKGTATLDEALKLGKAFNVPVEDLFKSEDDAHEGEETYGIRPDGDL